MTTSGGTSTVKVRDTVVTEAPCPSRAQPLDLTVAPHPARSSVQMSRSGQGVRGEAAWAGPFLAFIKSRDPGSAPSRTAGRTMRRAPAGGEERGRGRIRPETRNLGMQVHAPRQPRRLQRTRVTGNQDSAPTAAGDVAECPRMAAGRDT